MTVHIRRLASLFGTAIILVCAALRCAALSSPVADAPASGNLPRVRADLAGLNTKLSGLIRRMQAQEHKLGVARVRLDPAALLGTTKQLEAATLSAARQFAPVFGLPYPRTFTSLDCIDAQPALSRLILGQLEQGRLAAEAVNPSVYAFTFILTHLKSGQICSDALTRTLAVSTPIPRRLAQALRAQSRQLAGTVTSMKRAQDKAGLAGMRVSLSRLPRTMQQLAGAALRTVEFVPGVFYLPHHLVNLVKAASARARRSQTSGTTVATRPRLASSIRSVSSGTRPNSRSALHASAGSPPSAPASAPCSVGTFPTSCGRTARTSCAGIRYPGRPDHAGSPCCQRFREFVDEDIRLPILVDG